MCSLATSLHDLADYCKSFDSSINTHYSDRSLICGVLSDDRKHDDAATQQKAIFDAADASLIALRRIVVKPRPLRPLIETFALAVIDESESSTQIRFSVIEIIAVVEHTDMLQIAR